MKLDELRELYIEGFSFVEIGEELGLAPSTVAVYVYKQKLNKDERVMEMRCRALIKKQIEVYERRFKQTF